MELPSVAHPWRSRLIALGLRRAVLLITTVSVTVSFLLTALLMQVLELPEALRSRGLLIGVLVPLAIAPLVSQFTLKLVFELERTRRLLESAAQRDGLTGVYNRVYLGQRLDQELARVRSESRPLSILMLDVDNFKVVNDTFGHAVGDRVLVALCQICAQQLPAGGLLARYGGEEFVILLTNAAAEEAGEHAERLRQSLAGLSIPELASTRVTVSIGISCLAPWETTASDMMVRADKALYFAKRGGRNACCISLPEREADGRPTAIGVEA